MENNSSNEVVYGQTFSNYSKKEFEDFASFFERRLINNGISPEELFKDKICLDAGCGGGRGSWLMLKYGAKEVIGVDQSKSNINGFINRIKDTDKYSRFSSINSDLEDLDIDKKFDFIWFSGVIQHTILPSLVLEKVYKHLSIGGFTFFYAYGQDGIYWQLIDLARNTFNEISDVEMLKILSDLNLENRYIAEYIDDWKAPFIRAYSDKEIRKSLNQCGISPLLRLFWGESYDTCLRKKLFPNESNLWGEGDLRYFGVKTKNKSGIISQDLNIKERILSNKKDQYHPIINFCKIVLDEKNNIKEKVRYLAKVQKELRDNMNKNIFFDMDSFKSKIIN